LSLCSNVLVTVQTFLSKPTVPPCSEFSPSFRGSS
jgi:hypothetical protein